MRLGIFYKPLILFLVAALCAAGMWLYSYRVLVPHQKSDAAAHDRPRGLLSDLYPRWVGAKQLLLHGRDPYSSEVTREIQAGYYGRPLDPSRPSDPRDEQGFAYPVYVVFFLAPTIGLPFPIVQRCFLVVMLVLTLASALLWIRVLRWSVPAWTQMSIVALTLGSMGVMQGLRIQQLSLLVAGVVTIGVALLVEDHAVGAGVLFAFASIKPQLIVLLVVWLAIWTMSDWRRRWRLAASFLATMGILTAAAEWYLPHWIPRFWQAIREYQRYTGTTSVIGVLIGRSWGRAFEVLTFAAFLSFCWRERRHAADSDAFAFMLSLVLAITILVAPTYAPYNQVFLIPALLMLLKDGRSIWQRNVSNRFLIAMTAMLVIWPWITSVPLVALSFILPPEIVERGWAVPLWTVTQIPVAVAAMMLIHYYQGTFAAPVEPRTS
jgi:hypothetical protein